MFYVNYSALNSIILRKLYDYSRKSNLNKQNSSVITNKYQNINAFISESRILLHVSTCMEIVYHVLKYDL